MVPASERVFVPQAVFALRVVGWAFSSVSLGRAEYRSDPSRRCVRLAWERLGTVTELYGFGKRMDPKIGTVPWQVDEAERPVTFESHRAFASSSHVLRGCIEAEAQGVPGSIPGVGFPIWPTTPNAWTKTIASGQRPHLGAGPG